MRDTQFRRSYVKSGTGENFKAVWRLGKVVKAAKQKYKSRDCNTMNGWHSEALMGGDKDWEFLPNQWGSLSHRVGSERGCKLDGGV